MIYPMIRAKHLLELKNLAVSDDSETFLKFSGKPKGCDFNTNGYISYDEKNDAMSCAVAFHNEKGNSTGIIEKNYYGVSADHKEMEKAVFDLISCDSNLFESTSEEKQTKFCLKYAYIDVDGNVQKATRCFDSKEEAEKCADRLKASVGEDKIKQSEVSEVEVSAESHLNEENSLFTDDDYTYKKIVEDLEKRGLEVNDDGTFCGETVDKANHYLDCCGEFSVNNGHIHFEVSFVYNDKEVSGTDNINVVYNESLVDNVDPIDVQIERIVEDNVEYGGDIKSAVE